VADDDRYFEPDVELLPRAELAAYQEAKVLELLPHVYERSPLYRSVWDAAGVHPRDIRSLEDYRERIPFITRTRCASSGTSTVTRTAGCCAWTRRS
jgi:phenylacetate-CoA ligase